MAAGLPGFSASQSLYRVKRSYFGAPAYQSMTNGISLARLMPDTRTRCIERCFIDWVGYIETECPPANTEEGDLCFRRSHRDYKRCEYRCNVGSEGGWIT
jgi:hypothetical protein